MSPVDYSLVARRHEKLVDDLTAALVQLQVRCWLAWWGFWMIR